MKTSSILKQVSSGQKHIAIQAESELTGSLQFAADTMN